MGGPSRYDPRNLPSKGFTSLAYVLALVLFECLGANMMFAAFLLLFCACAGTVLVAALAVGRLGPPRMGLGSSSPYHSPCLLGLDSNLRGLMGWPFESLLSPLCLALFTLALVRALESAAGAWAACLFFSLYFVGHLARPENLLLFAPLGLALLLLHPKRGRVLGAAGLFAVGFGLFMVGKRLVFHDFFPTGYYRKIGAVGAGTAYLRAALAGYAGRLWIVAIGLPPTPSSRSWRCAELPDRKSGGGHCANPRWWERWSASPCSTASSSSGLRHWWASTRATS